MRKPEAMEQDLSGQEEVLTALKPDGSVDKRHDPKLSEKELLQTYRLMVLNRVMDERMITMQRQGRIGFYIGSVGEEAAILGSCLVMRKQDWVFPCYREHGAALMRGMPLDRFMANLFGTAEDPIQGRQMPCHEAWAPGNFASISSPIATQVPQAVGAAWAAKLKGDDVVSLVYFGEGATSANDFHVGLNFGGVYKVPTIFLCRNNGWAISIPSKKQTAAQTIAQKAVAYGIAGVRVDGNDLLAMVYATQQAHERARKGLGPTLIEALTYRVLGHSTSDDPRAYRKDEEVEPWRKKDPILRLKAHLEHLEIWDGKKDEALRKELEEEVRLAAAAAEKVGPPPIGSMFQDVYASAPWNIQEEQAEAEQFGYFQQGH